MNVIQTIENFSAPTGMIIREGKIFEAGDYPDKDFTLTPEELSEAVSAFSPVDLDLEHKPTILDGKLGKLVGVSIKNDKELFGKVELPEWLHNVTKSDPLKVSCTWDRATKKLSRLALVLAPRITDAALMSAFSASNPEEDSMTIDDVKNAISDALRGWKPEPVPAPEPIPAVEPPKPDFSEVEQREAALREREVTLLKNEAALFADGLIAESRILPAQKPSVVSAYVALAANPTEEKVVFSEDETKTGTPLEAFKFSYQNAPQHNLTQQQTGHILFDDKTDTTNETAERMKARAKRHLGISSEAK